jgi:hypothetical protein
MKNMLPWLKYDMLKKEFIEVILEKEKIVNKKMNEATKNLEDLKNLLSMFHGYGRHEFFILVI